jgi:hypothetical protein
MLHVPVRETNFTVLESVKSDPGTHQAHCSIGICVYFPGATLPGSESSIELHLNFMSALSTFVTSTSLVT